MALLGIQVLWLPIAGTLLLDPLASVLLTVLIVVLTVNAVNFVDGLDGLAAGIVGIAALALFAYSYLLSVTNEIDRATLATLTCALLAGVCMGFLPHNINPARIFMGDTGSMLIGLLLAASMITLTGRVDPSSLQESVLLPTLLPLILPAAVIDAPRLGSINVHASLLPRWRGAAPIQRALMAGDASTGITIMRIVEKLDAGPMLLKLATPIAADETGGTLHDRLAVLGGTALRRALDALIDGSVREEAQDEALVTYARKIERVDRRIDWHEDATVSARRIRALNPAPLAIATLGALEINVVAAELADGARDAAPGTLLAAADDGLLVRCGDGALRLTRVQPPGKRAMSAREFVNGYRRQLPL